MSGLPGGAETNGGRTFPNSATIFCTRSSRLCRGRAWAVWYGISSSPQQPVVFDDPRGRLEHEGQLPFGLHGCRVSQVFSPVICDSIDTNRQFIGKRHIEWTTQVITLRD